MALHAGGDSLEAVAQALARLGFSVKLASSAGGSLHTLKHTFITATRNTTVHGAHGSLRNRRCCKFHMQCCVTCAPCFARSACVSPFLSRSSLTFQPSLLNCCRRAS